MTRKNNNEIDDTIDSGIRSMIAEYSGPSASMDPIYFEIIRKIDEDFIGDDEDGATQDISIRNHARSVQRRILHSNGDDSLMIPIGFYLDTYKRSLMTSADDDISHWDIEKTVNAIINSIEKYLAVKARDVINQEYQQNDTEKALKPLFQKQLEQLGVL